MENDLKVPDEMKDLMLDYTVGIQCRNECINSFFRSKRAIQYGKGAEKASQKFWKLAYSLYPEIRGDSWVYIFGENVLRKEA